MNGHKHARLTPKGRALLVSKVLDQGCNVSAANEAASDSKRTGFKRLARISGVARSFCRRAHTLVRRAVGWFGVQHGLDQLRDTFVVDGALLAGGTAPCIPVMRCSMNRERHLPTAALGSLNQPPIRSCLDADWQHECQAPSQRTQFVKSMVDADRRQPPGAELRGQCDRSGSAVTRRAEDEQSFALAETRLDVG